MVCSRRTDNTEFYDFLVKQAVPLIYAYSLQIYRNNIHRFIAMADGFLCLRLAMTRKIRKVREGNPGKHRHFLCQILCHPGEKALEPKWIVGNTCRLKAPVIQRGFNGRSIFQQKRSWVLQRMTPSCFLCHKVPKYS